MEWSRRIYGYCERGFGPGIGADSFWAEPLNAITNAAFIIAAATALALALRERRLDGPTLWLILLTFVVGIGSFLFHTYAVVWAAIMDTTPIMLFILSYFAISMNRFGGFGWPRAIMLVVGFLALLLGTSYFLRVGVNAFAAPTGSDVDEGAWLDNLMLVAGFAVVALGAWVFVLGSLIRMPIVVAAMTGVAFFAAIIGLSEAMQALIPKLFPGMRSYLPAFLALLAVGLWLMSRDHPAGRWLSVVAIIFAASLTARALDRPLCAQFMWGTHWAWHLLNGVVLGSLIIAVIRHGRALARV